MGTGFALDLLLSSRRLGAEEAQRIGLVQRVTEPEALVDDACEWVRGVAAEVSPAAMRDTKKLVYRHGGAGYPEALVEADDWQWRAMDRADAREGARSYAERRPPRFERLGGDDA